MSDIKHTLLQVAFAQLRFFIRKTVDKTGKTAYNKPVKGKIAMKGPMPPLRSLERKPHGARFSA
jgi:hypothetical protein